MVGSLHLDVGGMFAEKSTALQRHGKRFMLAGKKVVFLKPAIDDRYSEDEIVTHDGQKVKASIVKCLGNKTYSVLSLSDACDSTTGDVYTGLDEAFDADVVCIDEVQFFPLSFIGIIDNLIHQGKKVYCAGLDLDRFGVPFGIVPYLMALAETVEKHHAVCKFCGNDAWVTIGSDSLTNGEQVNVGNDYIPACRTCAYEKGGIV